jgi:hypothetical protein
MIVMVISVFVEWGKKKKWDQMQGRVGSVARIVFGSSVQGLDGYEHQGHNSSAPELDLSAKTKKIQKEHGLSSHQIGKTSFVGLNIHDSSHHVGRTSEQENGGSTVQNPFLESPVGDTAEPSQRRQTFATSLQEVFSVFQRGSKNSLAESLGMAGKYTSFHDQYDDLEVSPSTKVIGSRDDLHHQSQNQRHKQKEDSNFHETDELEIHSNPFALDDEKEENEKSVLNSGSTFKGDA